MTRHFFAVPVIIAVVALGVSLLGPFNQPSGDDVPEIQGTPRLLHTPTPFPPCTTPTPLYGSAGDYYSGTICGDDLDLHWHLSKAPSPQVTVVNGGIYCQINRRDLDVSTSYAQSWDCTNPDGSDIGATYVYVEGNPNLAPLPPTPTALSTKTPTPGA